MRQKKLKFVLGRVENIVGRFENILGIVQNACDQHFLVSTQFFQKPFYRVVKSPDCVEKVCPSTRQQNSRLVQIETNCRHLKVNLE